MALRLLFLGRLQDVAGRPELSVEPSPCETVAVLMGRLEPGLVEVLLSPRVRVAINGTVVAEPGAARIADGDEIAFLPPVSGG